MTSSTTSMCIQFRTLTISEEKIQECVCHNTSTSSLLAAIEALDSPLRSHPECNLVTDLYSGSTPITIMNESDHRISFTSFKESVTSLQVMIGALGSNLGSQPESDLATDL
jgi:hypothetical protein